jgi:hypothetical protein
MKTPLLFLGALLAPALACETQDFIAQTAAARAHHLHVIEQAKAAAATKDARPSAPVKPATAPAPKAPANRPKFPAHLFM